MNTFVTALVCLAATASAGHLGYPASGYASYAAHPAPAYYAPNPAAHIPSGSVSVGHNGATLAGPAGSVRTDNGIHGHGAATVVDGPAGQISTKGGHTVVTGPGGEHGGYDGGYDGSYDGGYNGGYVAAPVAYAAAPVVYAAAPVHAVPGVGAWGPAAGLIGHGAYGYGGYGHGGYGHGGYGHGW